MIFFPETHPIRSIYPKNMGFFELFEFGAKTPLLFPILSISKFRNHEKEFFPQKGNHFLFPKNFVFFIFFKKFGQKPPFLFKQLTKNWGNQVSFSQNPIHSICPKKNVLVFFKFFIPGKKTLVCQFSIIDKNYAESEVSFAQKQSFPKFQKTCFGFFLIFYWQKHQTPFCPKFKN